LIPGGGSGQQLIPDGGSGRCLFWWNSSHFDLTN
jgi:hypothetical protein